jgi:xanthine dehydrogenase YagS FAD-binding subunit
VRGKPLTEVIVRAAAEAELSAAKGLRDNAFKIELAKRLIVDSVLKLGGTVGAAQ